MEEMQRQREALRLGMEQHGDNTRDLNNIQESEFNRLTQQIEQLTRRIEEFGVIRREDPETQAPPDYFSQFTRHIKYFKVIDILEVDQRVLMHDNWETLIYDNQYATGVAAQISKYRYGFNDTSSIRVMG
ncbi:hypothetical protein BDZ94DRAFT_1238763 [Collybia nuda]|uniref:Uncharacterized protein n=1 Tax=Collybia nuda TaxID=64659 RepID=A0A9P6CGK1_9AGAR|nr:hypothetical protein BDZ94DRAFT_1238763 [Collybia nuda]